ncbi:transcription termination factor NusA [Candidatus Zixiibacteriota bacterium]
MAEDINYEIIEALSQIARERNLKREIVLESLEIGLLTAAKRALGTLDPVDIDVDRETGTISIGIVKEVVATADEIEEPLLQITLEMAKELDPDTEVGWHIYVDVSVAEFGRSAIQAAKQVLQQRIREAERDKIFEEYLDREGEIVTGSVQQVTRGTILVNIGRVEAILPYREQIRRERFRQGDTIRALVKEVSMNAKGPSIVLSRADELFVRKLFAIEVPEIYEGIVEIKQVARAPGERCKVAVRSHDLRVDAVGACVGMKGSRVQSIVRELNNERIDIVPWSPDVIFFITKAIGPAKVSRVLIDEERKELTLILPEDQIALALGPGGTNARLAGELVGYQVDMVSESEYERAVKEVEGVIQRIGELDITDGLAQKLRDAGVEYVQDLLNLTPEEIQAIPGVGPATFDSIIEAFEAHSGQPYVAPERIEQEVKLADLEPGKDSIEDLFKSPPPSSEPAESEEVESVEPVESAEGLDETEWVIDPDILRMSESRTEGDDAEGSEDDKAPEVPVDTTETVEMPEEIPVEREAGEPDEEPVEAPEAVGMPEEANDEDEEPVL